MNNPLRAALQRRVEGPRLLRMGGSVDGGRALEIGCGRGVGAEVVLDVFGAGGVDGFDLDPRMIERARRRLSNRRQPVRLWTGDAAAIAAPDATYDAVFDFGILHHVRDWRRAVSEVARVLVPGGRLYAEEVLRPFVVHPVVRRVLDHPLEDRFDARELLEALEQVGLVPTAWTTVGPAFAWVVARKLQPLR